MLVLSRLKGESVILRVAGVEIRVCLVRVERDKVRIGFEAPPEVEILRSEIADKRDDDEFSGGIE